MHIRVCICYVCMLILFNMNLTCMWTRTAIGTGTCDGVPSAGEGDSLQVKTLNTILYSNIDMNMMNKTLVLNIKFQILI